MTAPTFVESFATAYLSNSTPKLTFVTYAAGDSLIAVGLTSNTLTTIDTPTGGTGITWVLLESNVGALASCNAYVWKATWAGSDVAPSGETFAFSVARAGGADWHGATIHRFSGVTGYGATADIADVAAGAPSLNITTTADDSALVVGVGDWNAVDGSSRTWRSVNGAPATETTYQRDGTQYGVYVGYHANAGAAGLKTVGLSAPGGQDYTVVAVEVLGSATGGANEGSASGVFTWAGSATGTNQPAVPANLQATAISDTEIDLSWDAVSGASGYDIERDGTIIVFDHPTTSYSDTGLTAEVEYDYRVRAVE